MYCYTLVSAIIISTNFHLDDGFPPKTLFSQQPLLNIAIREILLKPKLARCQ
jgi:hypothetical protein